MSYSVPFWAFISSGTQNVWLGYTWGGSDEGAQYAEGSPQDNGGSLVTNNQGKSLDLSGNFTYSITVSNSGSDTWMALEGGGVS